MTKIKAASDQIPVRPSRRLFDALAWIALASLILVTAAHLVTKPPAMPAYADVRAAWKPSEAWLYDRDGRLLDTIRVDFQRRRLGWVPLKNISPAVRDAVVTAEDRRFWSHGGIDWLAIAAAIRARWTASGGAGRAASTRFSAERSRLLARPVPRSNSRRYLA